ncbi:SLC13 family permease [Crocosphaera sp. UHCC 0190]|uniref:SLC13 family permease n=1 Tax=Crocosphaera sp. UHCC 0190 TaxID=3110246 RepID=UPI002B1F7C97|nr:SLC13 family permease [Crocosphaera sp. UHCC 0190]MEA5511463.1 SLC13 family permease [Crocosphaera sp. UHCC 0190]
MSIPPIALTLGILLLALISFIFEFLPVDTTAIGIAILLILCGLVTPEEGISGFSNSATITVMAMFILSAGITRTGVLQIVRDLLFQLGGRSLSKQIVSMGLIVGFISAFINNTAVVAVFLPIVEAWGKKRKISLSKLLIPLSYTAILGGVITIIGTSTNILASGLSKKLGYGEFSIFLITPVGIPTFFIGLTYLTFIAPRLLPERKSTNNQGVNVDYGMKDYVSEIIITPRSNLIGQTLRQSGIQRKFDIDVLEIIHNDLHFPQPLADKVLSLGDILLVRGSKDDLLQIRDERGVDILADVQFDKNTIEEELSFGEDKVAEVLILSNSRLIGSTLKDLRFRQRYNATVIAIRRGEELLRERLGKVRLRFGDLLLVQGPKESFIGLQTTRELLVLEERDIETLRQDKAYISLAIICGVVLTAAFNLLPILVSSLVGVMLMIFTGCLKPGEIYGAVRWDIIFLLAGLIPLGIAMENSGANQLIAQYIVVLGSHLSSYWVLVLFYLATALLTEILSNNASVLLMLPVAAEVAKNLGLNPLAFMLAVMFAASNSYMTPIGYQTNTMVYGPGGYRFLDFTRVGLPLTLTLTLIVPLLIAKIYGLS